MDEKSLKDKLIQNPYTKASYCNSADQTGQSFEKYIYDIVKEKVINDKQNIAYLYKRYYSLERQDYITVDISIEKYVDDTLFSIIIIECKDYKNSLSVDDVEEFHSKLQQIGADNTKGVIVTSKGKFQKSAILYAKSKGISLAYCNEYDDKRNVVLYCKKPTPFIIQLLFIPIYLIMDIIYNIAYLIMEYKYNLFDYKYNFYFVLDKIMKKT